MDDTLKVPRFGNLNLKNNEYWNINLGKFNMHMIECAKFIFKLLGNDKSLHQYWKKSYPNGPFYLSN
jgi:hypothetical protein